MIKAPSNKWLVLVPVLLALAVNANVLRNGPVWDDEKIIQGIKMPNAWGDIFVPENKSLLYYFRPMVQVSYLLDHKLWGRNPAGFHFSVWLLNGLNAALVFWLGRSLINASRKTSDERRETSHILPLTSHNSIPLVAASLFAVHPVHAEAVAWIAGRNDVLCAAFLMAAGLAYFRYGESGRIRYLFLSLVVYLLALLTKETAIGLLPVVLVFDLLARRKDGGAAAPYIRFLWSWAAWISVSVLYLGFHLDKAAQPAGNLPTQTITSFSPVNEAFLSAGLYLRMLVYPFPHLSYIARLPDGEGLPVAGAVLLAASSAGLLFALFRRALLPAVGLVWTAATLAPAVSLALFRITPTAAAERYVYIPSIGLLTALAWAAVYGLERLGRIYPDRSRALAGTAVAGIVLLIGIGGFESQRRNTVWRDPLSFWTAASHSSPGDGFPQLGIGVRLAQQGRYDEAEPAFRKAIRLDEAARGPNDFHLIPELQNLSNLYLNQKRYAEAEPLLKRVLVIREGLLGSGHPFLANDLANLASVYRAQGKNADAESSYRRAFALVQGASGAKRSVAQRVQRDYSEFLREQGREAEAGRIEIMTSDPGRKEEKSRP